MAIQVADLVLETANNPGTGTFNLAGTSTGRRTWVAAFGTAAQVFYVAHDGTSWEEGIGTVTSGSPNTLSRDAVLENSLGTTAKINFTSSVQVYSEIPGKRAIFASADNGSVLVGGRTLSGLLAGAAVSDAPRLDQVAWERLATASGAASAYVFSLPATHPYYAVEFELYLASAGQVYMQVSQDGGTTFLSSPSSYTVTGGRQTGSGGIVDASGSGGYVVLSPPTPNFVMCRIDMGSGGHFRLEAATLEGPPTSIRLVGFAGNTAALTNIIIAGVKPGSLVNIANGQARLLGARY